MNKSDLINRVSQQTGVSKAETKKIVQVLFASMIDALSGGDKISLVGFGSFRLVERAARKGRHPQTGEVIVIKAKKIVKFRPGKNLLRR
jgi:DNA-binding protein HU-beta